MKKLISNSSVMMEMCMWTCSMCMAFCAFISDIFSISKLKHAAI